MKKSLRSETNGGPCKIPIAQSRRWTGFLLFLSLAASVFSGQTFASPTSWTSRRYVAFGIAHDKANWVAVEVQTRHIEHLVIPEGFLPEHLAISPDGAFVVFTSFDRTVNNTLLFRMDRTPGAEPKTIGDRQGYHASPVVSSDGKWVFFAHHPTARGQPTAHEPRAYAQIYRVRVDGTQLEALTSGNGCHLGPTVSSSGDLGYVHTDCQRRRWFELTKASDTSQSSAEVISEDVNEPSLSPDGSSIVFWIREANSIAIYESKLGEGHRVLRTQLVPGIPTVRPQFGATRGEVIFQRDNGIWLLTKHGNANKLYNFLR